MKAEIEKLIYGGYGIATVNGKKVFVRGGLPGDVAEVSVTKDRKSHSFAEISELLKPSTLRVKPECAVFGRCGGCQWQDLDYSEQLLQKQGIVTETLDRIAKISCSSMEPIEPSDRIYGYRNRIVLSVVRDIPDHKLAFFEEETNTKVAVEQCPVADEKINDCMKRLSQFLELTGSRARSIEKIYVASGDSSCAATILQNINRNRVSRRFAAGDLSLTGNSEDELEVNINGKRMVFTPSVFTQANRYINCRITETLCNWLETEGNESVLDLYCGYGNFSIPLSMITGHVTGVDSNAKAVRYGSMNIENNGISNISLKVQHADKYLRGNLQNFDFIILDPPREGARDIMDLIGYAEPAKIAYISCNPATLARDLSLLKYHGYRIERIKPFDMFPHTYHIELLALLVKEDFR